MLSKSNFLVTNRNMDGIHLLGLHLQRFERFSVTVVTNNMLGKSFQLFNRFGVSTAIIPITFMAFFFFPFLL